MRIVIGNVIFPPVRQRYRPTCVISWSRQGYENASYCISQTGRQPAMQRPTAVPRIPASASGVSTQRDAPNRSSRPAVARKTPPARPTSSPSTITSSSRASSAWSAWFTASTSVSSAMADVGRRVDVGVAEEQLWVGRGRGLGSGDACTKQVLCFFPHGLGPLVVEQPDPAQERLVLPDALARPLFLDAHRIDVGARIVCRR